MIFRLRYSRDMNHIAISIRRKLHGGLCHKIHKNRKYNQALCYVDDYALHSDLVKIYFNLQNDPMNQIVSLIVKLCIR